MADNYLEKKMDDYRRGARVKTVHRATVPSLKPGQAIISYPTVSLFIAASEPDAILTTVVKAMRKLGALMTIACARDKKKATGMAWSAGATFDPSDDIVTAVVSDATRRGEPQDALIFIGDAYDVITAGKTIVIGSGNIIGVHYIAPTLDPETIAATIAFIVHPLASQIAPTSFADRREKP